MSMISLQAIAWEEIDKQVEGVKIYRKHKHGAYYNIPASFDIETTSMYDGEQKIAFMYEWTFGIGDYVLYGRTWDEFIGFYYKLVERLDLSIDKKLIVYVHNLAFEFQFICKLFTWSSVFSLDERKPVKALTSDGIEFRCSYQLSGYNLDTVAKNLNSHKISKLKGNLDYSLIHTQDTPLTDQELAYCENDVRIVLCYIYEQIEQFEGNITKIPLTNTGRVREYCRKRTLYAVNKRGKHCNNYHYMDLIKDLTLEVDEYKELKRAFQGGFTHANVLHVEDLKEYVSSYDFTSSYPAVMLSEKYPMSRGFKVPVKNKDQFIKYLNRYCCLFDCKFTNLVEHSTKYENYLSESKCVIHGKKQVNNGRLISADEVYTTVTDIDFRIITAYYQWDDLEISNFYIYRKDYLPKEFVKCILEFYGKKTSLKGVEGQEVEYQNNKGYVNGLYGMCVTDIDKDLWEYSTGWHNLNSKTTEENVQAYNESKSRFLFYPWGVWVTAYARRNLFTGIDELGADYIYADTDSLKFVNEDKHIDYFKNYNDQVIKKVETCLTALKLDPALASPKTIKGVAKPIGVWDSENQPNKTYAYEKFKTLGAKRYMVQHGDHIEITVAGLGKKAGRDYLVKTYGDDIFNHFNNNLYVPPESTGKLTHSYIDDPIELDVTDYKGNTSHVISLSGVHLEPASYSLSMSEAFRDLIKLRRFN